MEMMTKLNPFNKHVLASNKSVSLARKTTKTNQFFYRSGTTNGTREAHLFVKGKDYNE